MRRRLRLFYRQKFYYVHRLWRFVANHVGHRGAVMAFLTLLDLIYGYSLGVEAGPLAHTNLGLSLHIWSLIWIAVGVILATGISANRDKIHYAVAVMVKIAWASVMLRAWLFFDYPRGWVVAVIFGGFGALIFVISSWPEGSIHNGSLRPINKKPKPREGEDERQHDS